MAEGIGRDARGRDERNTRVYIYIYIYIYPYIGHMYICIPCIQRSMPSMRLVFNALINV